MVRIGLLVLVQPAALVPLVVHVVVVLGVNEAPLPNVPRLEIIVYVLAPLPLMAVVALRHITELTAVAVTLGRAITVTVTASVF